MVQMRSVGLSEAIPNAALAGRYQQLALAPSSSLVTYMAGNDSERGSTSKGQQKCLLDDDTSLHCCLHGAWYIFCSLPAVEKLRLFSFQPSSPPPLLV